MRVITVLQIAITLCIASPGLTLRIKTNDDELSGITASPTLIYRRRLNSDRYQSIYPPTSPSNSIEETKTESSDPQVDQPINSYLGTTEHSPRYSTTSNRPKKLKSIRRNRSRIRTVTLPQASVEQEQYTPKPNKPHSNRRRKVKRPNKTKPVPSKPAVKVEEGVEGDKSNSTTASGDKNLALEIGSEDGKYALINKFFDEKPSQAPGLVSYAASDDFPRNDNQYTLGNVKENDIWLSDGHLLVLKGGDLDASLREHWKPIDNYQRGNRPPLRIALDSDNPPPFPVFVNDTGPPVFLGPLPPFGLPYPPPGAFNESFDPSRLPPPGMVPLYPNGSIPEYFGPPGAFGGFNNSLFPQGPPPGQYGGGYGYGGPGNFSRLPPPPFFPFPPPGNRNGSGGPPGFLPPPPGFNRPGGPPSGYPFLPPLVLNPNDNETDDPSIFLPPPYDFDYQDDNTTIVPPGPFAPGLVVPPPKNFYTVYNKTTKRPTLPPAIGLSYSFGKRPQRPNAKKPKFPMTNPPDDSEEAYQPIVTTPYPYYSDMPLKKRKQRPGKANKVNFMGSKYEADTDVGNIVSPPIPVTAYEEPEPQPPPLINAVITNTIAPTIVTTPKPLNNYVYVRGQLKSLAELNQPSQEEQLYQYDEATPRPPYDERGYPTRVVDENDHVILQYNKKPTEVPVKSVYYNTPKYDVTYNTYTKKPKKVQNQYFSINQNERPVSPRPQIPIVLDQQSPSIYLNNNRLSNQNQNVFGNTFQDKVTPIDPIYYNSRPGGLQQQKHSIIQLQSPKSYPHTTTTNNRQQHSYSHANVPQQNINYGNSGFRPAFGPTVQPQQQSDRSKALFPGQVRQSGPIFDFQNPYYQQQGTNQQVDGYYSPVTQYYQPLQPVQQQQNNYFPNSQQYFNNNQNQNNVNPSRYQQQQQTPQQQQQQQQFQPFFRQQTQSQPVNGQGLNTEYRSPLHQFLPQSQQAPLSHDLYVNYREPLPQYNTESESVTTRTAFRAGPSKAPSTGAETKTGVPAADGSYYSFQRGGPGGFSYKIQL